MTALHRVRAVWRRISFGTEKLTLCSCRCHTTRPEQLRGAADEQGIKRHKKERAPCQPVLGFFDQQYSQELGDLWASTRSALLDPQSWQYGVLLNRFTAVTDITKTLQSQGFSSFLPQTEVSSLLPDATSPESRPENQTGKDSLFSISRSSDDSGPQHVSPDPSLTLPRPSLQCYIHTQPLRFPSQAHRPGQLKQYYLLNAASLLPVLALHVRDGEKVLDLCSAPGGKALAVLQCATPGLLCCNEPDPHRRDWLAKTLESYVPHSLRSKVMVSAQDGRRFQSEDVMYDKVLVDAPCSNDRSWLYSCSSQQGEQRLKERARLPALQAQLLRSALSVVRPGGLVVYSTCTLSNSENSAVVEAVLNDFPEAEPQDLWEELAAPLSEHFVFRRSPPGYGLTSHKHSLLPEKGDLSSSPNRLGILVVPQPGKTWGPMFLSRIRKRT